MDEDVVEAVKTALAQFLDVSGNRPWLDGAARTAILAYEAAQWRPIETAPRDGGDILVGWYDQFGTWVYIAARARGESSQSPFFHHANGTHWRPLPAAPQRPASSGDQRPESAASRPR